MIALKSSRRQVLKAGLWAAPAVSVVAVAPAFAISQPDTCPPLDPAPSRWQEPSASLQWVPTKKTIPAGQRTFPGQLIIVNDGNATLPVGTEVQVRARTLAAGTRYPTTQPYAKLAAATGANGEPALLAAATLGYQSTWALKCDMPPGSQLTVDLEWQAPDGGYPAQVGQFVAALTVNPSANEFFTAVTKELTTDM